ncbi:MAG: choice-of-anchor L domain-containing protein [Bacteroidota bacterium]|jgi:gliding motility-associated-like protein
MLKKYLAFFILSVFLKVNLYGQLLISNQGASPLTIVQNLVGNGLTVTNVVLNCPSNAYGTFSNGLTTCVNMNAGILLTTGNVNQIPGPAGTQNFGPNVSTGNGVICSDPQLNTLEPLANYDCCILEFDVAPSCTTLQIRFVFGSEEYPEYVSSSFNDAFGFFVTGPNPAGGNYNNTNVATLPNNTTIVSVDNVNQNVNSAFYINNGGCTTIAFDGLTTVLTRNVQVVPCQTYHFKLAIADAGDGIYDSGVFVDFLECVNALAVNTTTSPVSCFGNDGSATANISLGYPPYTVTWNTNPPQTTPTATGLTPGVYQVTVDDAGSCTPPVVQTVTVTSNAAIPTLNVNSQTICAGQNVTLTATASSAGGSYSWTSNPPGFSANTQSITVSPSSTTTYSCTYNNNGCIASNTGTVTVNPVPTLSVNSTTICVGQSASLNATPSIGGGSYSWTSTPSGFTSSNSTINVNPTTTTTYSCNYSLNGCPASSTGIVNVNPNPTATASNNGPYCAGTTINLSGNGGASYNWSGPNGFTSTTQNPTITTSTSGNSGVYTLTVTSNNCTSVATTSVNILANPIPNLNSNGPVCAGTALSINCSNGVNWSWTGPNGFVTGTQNNTLSPVSVLSSGTYSVTISDVNGCTGTGTINVVVNPLPVITASTTPICTGFSGTLTASGASTYFWSGGTTPSTGASVSASPVTTTTYTVTGLDANGCIGSTTVSLVVSPNLSINTSPSDTICQGSSTILSASTSGGGTFTWNPGGQSGSTLTVSPTSNTTYTVNGVNSIGCTGTTTVSVFVAPTLTVTALTDSANCNGQCSGQASITVLPNTGNFANYSYQWSGGNSTGSTANSLCAGNYSVNVIDAAGCSNTVNIIISEPQPITLNLTGTDVLCFGGTNGSAVATATGGNGNFIFNWSNSSNGAIQNNLTAGTYSVIVTDINNCSTTGQVIINQPSTPLSVTLSSTSIDCNNPTATITSQVNGGTPNYNFSWSPSGTGSNPSGLSSGIYTVTVTDANNCQATQTITVNGNALPPNINAGNTGILDCGINPSTTLNGSSSTTGVSYSWSGPGGFNSTSANPLITSPGIYTLTVTDPSNGCSSSDTVYVVQASINAAFTPNPTIGNAPLFVDFTNNSSNATGYVWNFGNGSTSTNINDSITYFGPGTYTVMLIATNQYGCIDTALATIMVNGTSFILIPNIFSPNGDGTNELLSIQHEGITELNMLIYDRWGLLMAEVNDPNGGWDGKTKTGGDAPDGTYFYIVEAKGIDGKEYGLHGYFMLSR